MTSKRFKFDSEVGFIDTKKCGGDTISNNEVVELLNELHEEKKELQFQCNLLREQANEFHRGARENAHRVGKLEEENEQLKTQLFETSKELLWATSDEVDRALYYEEEVEELRKEIFE